MKPRLALATSCVAHRATTPGLAATKPAFVIDWQGFVDYAKG